MGPRSGEGIAILIANLTKRFGSLKAVDDISFSIEEGEVFGILGSNGAGKTTTLKIICGLLKPDLGSVRVAGIDALRDPVGAKRVVGYLPEAPALYDLLTGREFLEMIGTLRGMKGIALKKRIDELLDILELASFQNKNVGTYSRGMRQKLAFSASVMHDPAILILDEPLPGLDPRFGKLFKEWIKDHAKDGNTVLLSTHVTSTAEEICDRIGIIHGGKLLKLGSVKEVLEASGTGNLEDAFVALVGGKEWRRLPSTRRTP